MRYSGRRYHPAGTPLRGHSGRRAQRRSHEWVTMRGGNLVRSLTPRQAVVWLMHLDELAAELPAALRPEFEDDVRHRLARALRARVATREGLTRRKRLSLRGA
ncbi:MAG TPA: hypothetical protein VFC93_17575 [Chloroflexota bacterium]|nr:hypothetical protein [Chloroflexota bacterium]